ncbi:MAG TPA: hypothetical protein VME41_11285 [Stellaceae bacterium]|nr:hypothetical protein [Stellaceae bacterium]
MDDLPLLFRRCRAALGLSAQGMARLLRVSGYRTVQRWEAGDRDVPGPAWVALRYMLSGHGHAELVAAIDSALAAHDNPAPARDDLRAFAGPLKAAEN